MDSPVVQIALPIAVGIGVGYVSGNPAAGFAAATAVGGGMQAANAYQAAQEEQDQVKQQAKVEKVDGAARAAEIRRQMAATLGSQRAMLGSRGIAQGIGGTPGDLEARARERYESDLAANNLNSLTAQSGYAFQRRQLALAGTAGIVSGIGTAATAGYGYYSGRAATGNAEATAATASGSSRTSAAARRPFIRRTPGSYGH